MFTIIGNLPYFSDKQKGRELNRGLWHHLLDLISYSLDLPASIAAATLNE
jgi:hypothetical protein